MKKILMIAMLIFVSYDVFALSEKTHEAINMAIAQRSINGFSLDTYLKNQLGFSNGKDQDLIGLDADNNNVKIKVFEWLGYGGVQEDRPGDWQDFVLGNPTRSYNHFHNPLKPWSEAGLNDTVFGIPYTGESSVLWAQDSNQIIGGQWSWQTARSVYFTALTAQNRTVREKYFAKTFRAVGQLMHLIQDASVPEHVRNDAHGYGVREAYEGYVDRIRVQQPNLWNAWISNPITFAKTILDISSANTPAPVPISRIIDTDKYVGTNPGITKTDATLPSGQVIGLSEYTNANFLSLGTLFTDDFSPTDQHYFPYPSKENVLHWFDDSNSRGYVEQNGTYAGMDVEPVKHLAVQSLLYGYRMLYFPGQTLIMMPFGLDEKCREEYASKLLPRAVGYSAGLLNYFFRGQIDMIPDRNTLGKYVIKNNSNENMSGTFSLYYDGAVDNRILITSWDFTINANNQSTPVTFTVPSIPEPKEKDKYVLVFKGTLGNESGAVVGKVVKLKKVVDGRMVILSDARYPSITVITASGTLQTSLPPDRFLGAQSVRFDVDDYNTFVVMAYYRDCTTTTCIGSSDFHKFLIDENNQKILYQGIVLSIPDPYLNRTEVHTPIICDPTDIHTDVKFSYEYLLLSDFYIQGGNIKPFGSLRQTVGEYVGTGGCSIEIEGNETNSLYFGSPINTFTYNWTGGYFSCHDESHSAEVPSIVQYVPQVIFNDSDYAYQTRLQTNYCWGWGTNWQFKTTLPIQVPQSNYATMLRKDGKYSFFSRDYMSNNASYSTEIGVVNCSNFLIGEENIGWHIAPGVAEIVKFNSCSDWQSLLNLGGGYNDDSAIFDVSPIVQVP